MILLFVAFLSSQTTHARADKPHAREGKDNIASFFLGTTRTQGSNVFTGGLEYHRIILFPFGVTLVYENTPKNVENRRESELYGLVTWNLPYDFLVGFGPGWRFQQEEPSTFLTRIKLGYIFLLPGNIEILPNINYDFNPNVPAEWIGGVSIGKQF